MNAVVTIEDRYSRPGIFDMGGLWPCGFRGKIEITPDDLTPAERERWEKFEARANETHEVAHLRAKDVYLGKLKRYSDALFNIAHDADSLAEARSRARRALEAPASGDAV